MFFDDLRHLGDAKKTFAQYLICIILQSINGYVEELDLSENPIEDPNEIDNEVNLFSFIVRVWMEDSDSEQHQAVWRGHITPVREGDRHYFTDINEIPALMATHLKMQR